MKLVPLHIATSAINHPFLRHAPIAAEVKGVESLGTARYRLPLRQGSCGNGVEAYH